MINLIMKINRKPIRIRKRHKKFMKNQNKWNKKEAKLAHQRFKKRR